MRYADEGVLSKEEVVVLDLRLWTLGFNKLTNLSTHQLTINNVKTFDVTQKMPNFVHFNIKIITIKTYNYGNFN
jgi:hypothetical protein